MELLMLLYTEKQLEDLYKIYAQHQNRNGVAFMKLEDFRALFEEMLTIVFDETDEWEEVDDDS
jgi:hypothetical protein